MNMLTRIVASRFIFSLLLIAPAPLIAQSSTLHQGEEVRVRWRQSSSYYHPGVIMPRQSTVGVVVDASETHIMLQRRGRFITLPLSSVTSVERRIGTKPASAPAIAMGSGIGFVAGVAVGLVVGSLDRSARDGDAFNTGITTGMLLGAPIGALAVYVASRSRGIYEAVEFGGHVPTVAVEPSGRLGLSFRVGTR